jgi:hypothetical protein
LDQLTFKGWTVEFDLAATQSLYAKNLIGAAEQCGCLECRNFIAARNQGLVYPAEIVQLFHTLGIDTARECDLYTTGRTSSGHLEYGGWFDGVGTIIADANESTEITVDFQLIPVTRPSGLFRLEFQVNAPWIL